VSLLPVHHHLDEERLVARGLSNYWGYNTLGFFAVEPRYASGAEGASPREEFRAMVRRLHAAGLEVIVDVVYNHTAETDESGPALCWRGLDNLSYYRQAPHAPGRYENFTGCGNTLDLRHPRVLQMVMDSLRHWVAEMGVDGFRFDLAPVLARGDHGFDRCAPFFHAVAQDPVLAGVKLIAEPWDVGPHGWRTGDFPGGWLEWNDRFRDGVRGYWLARTPRGEFARRLAGSSDLFHSRHRQPTASVNFVTAHDGFTLSDLVSHDRRHNEANGEGNRDGHAHNLSWNAGAEGKTHDPAVLERRARLRRALLATLLLSQGTPMLTAGDELGHGQRGNNNPYCQDNETTWIAWTRADEALADFTARVVALRRERLPLGVHWHTGRPDAHGEEDLGWWDAQGRRLQGTDWTSESSRAIGARLRAGGRSARTLMLLANPHAEDIAFTLPAGAWRTLLDTAREASAPDAPAASPYPLAARSLALLEAAS
jgi:glycogen operon protein